MSRPPERRATRQATIVKTRNVEDAIGETKGVGVGVDLVRGHGYRGRYRCVATIEAEQIAKVAGVHGRRERQHNLQDKPYREDAFQSR